MQRFRSFLAAFTCMSLTVLSFCFTSVFADADPDVLFSRAKSAYARQDYSETYTMLKQFVEQHGTHEANRHLVPLLVESAVRTAQYDVAIRLFTLYKNNFPQSAFMPRMWYLHGYALSRQKKYTAAFTSFSHALDRGLSSGLDTLVEKNVRLVCRYALSADEMTDLSKNETLHPRIKKVLAYHAIVKNEKGQRLAQAQSLANAFLDTYPDSRYHADVKAILKRVKKKQTEQIHLGLLAPISGYHAEIGKHIVHGTQLAVDRHNATQSPRINLVIRDTKGDMVTTAQHTLSLRDRYNTSFFLGPILSANAVVSTCLLLDNDAVLLSPTATDAGIAQLGDNIFQMNSTLHSLGSRIATYAINNLNIREFAILAPWSEYGQILAKEFSRTVERNGGTVISTIYFTKGTHDFKEQFYRLRREAAERIMKKRAQARLRQAPADTARTSISIDSSFISDSTIEVGGLFVPAQAEDAAKIARQCQFYKIRTQLLGSTGWHDNKVIIDGDKYVNNAIISSNFNTNTENEQWPAFERSYRERFGSKPVRTSALAYDGTRLLIECIRKNAGMRASSRQVCECLRSTSNYQGLSGEVTFDPESGTNTESAIFKITNGTFVRIK